MTSRLENDLLGPVEVPADAYYGAQTQRAIQNFPVGSQRTIGTYPTLVRSLLLIKKAAAQANQAAGCLSSVQAEAISQAADQLLQEDLAHYFPVHALHGGGGTSANMNANEVLANLGEERLGGKRGEYRRLHPNDHVNLNQSTNDVYPTACHLAVIAAWPGLAAALQGLALALTDLAQTYQDQARLARTCWQDAVEVSYRDYWGGMASQVRRLTQRAAEAVDRLYAVNLGGTICGRAEDAPPAYREQVLEHLRRIMGDERYHVAPDLFDAAQNPDDLAAVSSRLDLLARSLVKIANDFRALSSGPESGIGELHLPAVQPGSSIMPGKVNPVMPEFLMQICFRVMGNQAMCLAGLEHGELDLNVWESSMVFAILESMELLETGVTGFTEKCVQGIHPDPATNQRHLQSVIPRLTRLASRFGYSRVTQVCKDAGGDLDTLHRRLDAEFGTETR